MGQLAKTRSSNLQQLEPEWHEPNYTYIYIYICIIYVQFNSSLGILYFSNGLTPNHIPKYPPTSPTTLQQTFNNTSTKLRCSFDRTLTELLDSLRRCSNSVKPKSCVFGCVAEILARCHRQNDCAGATHLFRCLHCAQKSLVRPPCRLHTSMMPVGIRRRT